MLSDDDHQEVHILAAKADRLWAIHGHRMHGNVAAVAAGLDAAQISSGSDVNAVQGAGKRPSKRGGGQARGRGRGRSILPPRSAAAATSAPAALARDSAGLCYVHWHFGDQAVKYEAPCSWQGN